MLTVALLAVSNPNPDNSLPPSLTVAGSMIDPDAANGRSKLTLRSGVPPTVKDAANSTKISSPIAAYLAKDTLGLLIDIDPLAERVGEKSVNVFVFKSSVSFRYRVKNQSFSRTLSSNNPMGDSTITVIPQAPQTLR